MDKSTKTMPAAAATAVCTATVKAEHEMSEKIVRMERTERTMMSSEFSAPPPEPVKKARTERTEWTAAATAAEREESPLFDLNLTVEENLQLKLAWYEVKYAEILKENAKLRMGLAEANHTLRKRQEELDRRGSRKRSKEEVARSSHRDQVRKRARSSAPSPPERQRRQYAPWPQRQYCEICRMKNHSTEECRVRNGACFGCGDLGHRKYECPWKKDLKKRQHHSPENVPKRDDESSSPRQRGEKL